MAPALIGEEAPAGAAHEAGPPPSKHRHKGTFTLDQYAALCAEIAIFPEHAERVFARYGLTLERKRLWTDLRWQNRLRQNPDTRAEWERLYLRHYALFLQQARRRKGPTNETS